jgi:hypothetical protein
MATISARGWRRDERWLVTTIEQPSLLPKAFELLAQEGIDEAALVAQCRQPADLFRTVTSRTPEDLGAQLDRAGQPPSLPGVVWLLERRQSRSSATRERASPLGG